LDEIAVDAPMQFLKLCSRREVQISDIGCWLRFNWRGAPQVGDVVDLRRIAVMAESLIAVVGLYVCSVFACNCAE
jgi:hypothetical protein